MQGETVVADDINTVNFTAKVTLKSKATCKHCSCKHISVVSNLFYTPNLCPNYDLSIHNRNLEVIFALRGFIKSYKL